jgi:ATP-dependent DNA helicase RecG
LFEAEDMELDLSVSKLGRLTKRNLTALRSMGIESVRDLIFYFPSRHEDFTRTVPIAAAPIGEHVTVVAHVVKVRVRRSFRRHISMTEAVLEDESGSVTALWFNQPYLTDLLSVGGSYRFAGKLTETKMGRRLINPLYESADKDVSAYAAPLVPVYPVSAGISQHTVRRLVLAGREAIDRLDDHLPAMLLKEYRLAPLGQALTGIHFPRTTAELADARRRLGFDELFRLQLFIGRQRHDHRGHRAAVIPFDAAAVRRFVSGLPFVLTEDQRVSAYEILRDMAKDTPMHRLLDGDVGSGKTAVAAIAMSAAVSAGFQCALMAPTEILARQHFETIRGFFSDGGPSVALWTNSYKRSVSGGSVIDAKNKTQAGHLRDDIAAGGIGIIIGTHALIEETLSFAALSLAVIDEQHRFGVRVRQLLCQKSGLPGIEPHLLSMTATPIPRSLALTVYGDLDLSLLRQKPKDRKPVMTRIVPPRGRTMAYEFIRKEIAAGRQAFIVCPLIDPSDSLGSVSVMEEYECLSHGEFAGIPMAALHGKMTSEEKERVMRDFLDRRTLILVSTSVVEVGVDVPNASVMCIEGAERFGLSQLHQFRGRVGRSEHQSFCLLFPNSLSPATAERLGAIVATNDGFILAEKDLELRGPGDLLGKVQSGFPPFRVASLGDAVLIKEARQAAEAVLAADPELERHPLLRDNLEAVRAEVHLE